ncbi:MAG TPA: hypothetical protein VKY35_01405 [Aliidiomarina sp.]|nr:hypothetical protein [Aliidiomarina sp.]
MTKPLTGQALEQLLQEATIITLTGGIEVRLVVLENQDYRLLVLNGAIQSVQDKRDPARLVLAHQVPLLSALAGLPTNGKVLELGLGGGSAMAHARKHFPTLNWLCLEQSASVISLYFDHFGPEIVVPEQCILMADAYEWLTGKGQGEQFNLVLCDVYERLDVQFLEACARAVKPGGVLAINWLPHMQNDDLGGEELDRCTAISGWSRNKQKIAGFRNRVYQLTRPVHE